MVKMNINFFLLPMKAQFFLWNAGTAPVVPFLPIYARQLGLSSAVVGIIYAVLPVIGMLAKPSFGGIADKYHCQKILFIFFQAFTAISLFTIHFTPEIPLESEMTLHCSRGLNFLQACSDKTQKDGKCPPENLLYLEEKVQCQVHCDKTEVWKEFCSRYGKREYCESDLHHYPLVFDAEIPMNYTEEFSCIHFKIGKALFPSGEKVPYCGNHTSSVCSVSCENAVIRDTIAHTASDSSVTKYYQFWMFVALLIFGWVGMAVVVSVGDAICFGMLGDKPSLYGHQRLWGAVGWGIFSLFAGWLVDEFSKGESKKDYTSIFYLSLIMLILDMVVSSRLKYVQTKRSPNIASDVGKLLEKPNVLVFLLWTVTVGLCTGLLWQFLFWYLEDLVECQPGTRVKTLEGLIMAVQCFGGEVPFFFLSGRILQKIGHINCMTLVLLGFAVRFILYSILTNPWWCLPIEFFQGITYGIFYTTMASYASKIAPPGTEASVQGLVGALFEGVGVSLGSLLGGFLYEALGGGKTFLAYGIGALVMSIVHVIVQSLMSTKYTQSSKAEDPDTSSAHYTSPSDAIQILQEHSSAAT